MSGITLHEVGGSLVIDVPDEQTLIGRGQFLQVTDKRVSRSHALLNVVDRKLYITPTHTNPCFVRRNKNKEQSIMTKDVKTLLNHGDAFGLLPDQLFYLVSYPQMNGNKDTEKVEEKEQEVKDEKPEKENEKLIKTSPSIDKANLNDTKEELEDDAKKQSAKDDEKKEEEEEEVKEEDDKDETNDTTDKKEPSENEDQEVETPAGNMALPLEKKRPLPDWMKKVSDTSPQKAKPSPKKVTAPAVSKREPGQKLAQPVQNEDHDEEEDDEEEEEEKLPTKNRAMAKKDSDEDEEFDEADISDDDYVPEAMPKATKSRSRRKRYSESDDADDFSDDDDDDDYAPSKKRSRTPKKTPKGKGKKAAKGRQTPSRSAKKATGRGRKKYSEDDDDEDEVLLPRRRGANYDDDDDEDSQGRRPQRAARQKRGSYVDDPMIEEALEDFASEGSVDDGNKDSDFDVNEALDSGSDWDKKGKKQKVARPTRPTKTVKSPRSATKKGKKKAPRRPSRSKTYSDDDDDDEDMEDDEPYVPRPSKRRAAASQESGESDDDKKKRRRREPCQYGHKCYRKNPVHFRTYCHPGDSSYDEEDKDSSPVKDNNKKPKDTGKTTPDKPSRPQRSTAGTRLVTQGADDDAPDTYDYNDSFIDDGTQPTDDDDDNSDQDSDYDASEDAKKLLKNKKLAKPVGAD